MADAEAWFQFDVLGAPGNTFCTISFTGTTAPTNPQYNYGINVENALSMTFLATGPTNGNPPCSIQHNEGENVYQNRAVYCPKGEALTYQSSPALGPYCVIPTTYQIFTKVDGSSCPCNRGSGSPNSGAAAPGNNETTKEDVDVANANVFLTETDYDGGVENAIHFVRTYNSLVSADAYSGLNQPANAAWMGMAWSATYFQFLLPVTLTDSSGTHNAVYAYRPDGRVLLFNEYQGVYSPDGDVDDSLVQTSSGWEYQTADDTIETYSSTGQLVSVAPRGKAAVTVNYNSGATLGDPPVSVSDAFGHTLQFSFVVDSKGKTVLASITDPAGKVISYTHDTVERLTSATNADSTVRSYSYANSQNGYLVTGVVDESNQTYKSWTYGGTGGTVTGSQQAGGVDAYTYASHISGAGGYVTVTDPLGKARNYYQSLIWGGYRMTSSNAVCPGCGEDESRSYDTNGNVASRTDFSGNVTQYTYDETTNLETSRTEAYGTSNARTITTSWDANWHQPDTIVEPNRTSSFTYDSMGNVLTKTTTDTTVTPNVSRTWTYTYDSYGRMLTAKGPRTDVNSTTTYTYYTCTMGYQCGELETVTDPVGTPPTRSKRGCATH